jgi:rubredoxin
LQKRVAHDIITKEELLFLTNNLEVTKMDKYECTICGYIYDEAEGDADNGIAAGTKFADLPDDWACPTCGAGKDAFQKM